MKLFTFIAVLFFFALSTKALSQGFLNVKDQNIVNQKGEVVRLRGLTLDGWLTVPSISPSGNKQIHPYSIKEQLISLAGADKVDPFLDAWVANYTREIDIGSLAVWGYNSVVLPIDYRFFTLPAEKESSPTENTWIEKGFAVTDSLLRWCSDNKIYLILSLKVAPGFEPEYLTETDSLEVRFPNEMQQKKTIALWQKISARYANSPWIGGYNILQLTPPRINSDSISAPCNSQYIQQLRRHLVDITKAIRETDPRHLIIVDGACSQNNYTGVLPGWDNAMVLGIHDIGPDDENLILEYEAIGRQHNIPLILNVANKNSNAWYTETIRLLDRHGIGWISWPLKQIGTGAPLGIKINAGYQQILDYCAGVGPKPSPKEINRALTQLACDVKLENCLYHKDVTDAMFRQVRSREARPFQDDPISGDFKINAVEYDFGRNGVAYYDRDTINVWEKSAQPLSWNRRSHFRNDGVDIKQCKERGQYYVTDFETGEWLQYTFHLEDEETYTISLTVASMNIRGEGNKGKISLEINGEEVRNALPVPNTGGDEHWVTVEVRNVVLQRDTNVIRIKAKNGGFNFKAITFMQSGKNFAAR